MEVPKHWLIIDIAKSAYLKKPKIAIFTKTDKNNNVFLPVLELLLSIAFPKIKPINDEKIIKNT